MKWKISKRSGTLQSNAAIKAEELLHIQWKTEERRCLTIAQAVVKRIYELCDERGVTINRISSISGITQSTVSDIVNGSTVNAGIVTVEKLCDGFEISVREFFDNPLFDDLEQEVR